MTHITGLFCLTAVVWWGWCSVVVPYGIWPSLLDPCFPPEVQVWVGMLHPGCSDTLLHTLQEPPARSKISCHTPSDKQREKSMKHFQSSLQNHVNVLWSCPWSLIWCFLKSMKFRLSSIKTVSGPQNSTYCLIDVQSQRGHEELMLVVGVLLFSLNPDAFIVVETPVGGPDPTQDLHTTVNDELMSHWHMLSNTLIRTFLTPSERHWEMCNTYDATHKIKWNKLRLVWNETTQIPTTFLTKIITNKKT